MRLQNDPVFGAALGFIAGLIHGSSVGQSMGSFIVTRTTTGFLAGLITSRLFGENPIVTILSTGALTIVCEIIFLLVNPRPLLYIAVQTIIGETIYNIIFALLFYIFLRYITTRRKIRLANARI